MNNEYIGQQLEKYRKKLLNLSLRNPLLNYRGRKQDLRIVDTTVDLFMNSLENGSPRLAGLLPQPSAPPDEQTESFRAALESARMTDEGFVQARAQLEASDSDIEGEEERIEAELRKRVREELGLPPRRQAVRFSSEEWAREIGINPSFDLPRPGRQSLESSSSARVVQTLLSPDELERAARKARSDANRSMQEMGINTLNALVGFLEWYESNDSDRVVRSPLLLYPIEVKRLRRRGAANRFNVTSMGDGVEANFTLLERLTQMGIDLPAFEEDSHASEYLRRVADAVRGQSRWRVRRWITITNITSSRMVLYRDLDPQKNPSLLQHDIVRDLLIGRDSHEPAFAEVFDVDNPKIADQLTSLIYDADSTQLSAVKDVLDGKNLVVKGPPGTGKSQTITNIIAATLARGKSVLFVAEKMAALDVVRNRLDQAQLGHYCLELHSTHANRSDVLASLSDRIGQDRTRTRSMVVQQKRKELANLRATLNDYAKIINQQYGSLGLSIHQLLWRLRRFREVATLPAAFRRYKLPNLLKLTEVDLERVKNALHVYGQEAARFQNAHKTAKEHPWFGVHAPGLDPMAQESAIDVMRDFANRIEEVRSLVAFGVGNNLVDDLPHIKAVRSFLSTPPLPKPPPGIHSSWIGVLSDRAARAEIRDFLRDANRYRIVKGQVESCISAPLDGALDDERLERASQWVVELDLDSASVRQLGELSQKLELEIRAVQAREEVLAHLGSLANPGNSASSTEAASRYLRALSILRSVPRDVLIARSPETTDEANATTLQEARNLQVGLRSYFQRQNLSPADIESLEPSTVLTAASVLQRAGALSFLSGSVRAARASFRRWVPDAGRLRKKEMVRTLEELGGYLQSRKRFAPDGAFARAVGSRFRGFETDFGTLASVAAFAEAVRNAFPPVGGVDSSLRTLLLQGTMDDIDAFMHVGERDSDHLAAIVEAARDVPEHLEDVQRRADILSQLRQDIDALDLAPTITFGQIPELLSSTKELTELENRARENVTARHLLEASFAGVESDTHELNEHLTFANTLDEAGFDNAAWIVLSQEDRDGRIDERNRLQAQLRTIDRSMQSSYEEVRANLGLKVRGYFGGSPLTMTLDKVLSRLRQSLDHPQALRNLVLLQTTQERVSTLPEVASLLKQRASLEKLVDRFEHFVVDRLVAGAFDQYDVLARFGALAHEQARHDFCTLDEEIIRLDQIELVRELSRRPVPRGNSVGRVGDLTDLSAIQHHANLTKPRITIRRLLQQAGAAIQALKPCFLMSPLSVGHYLDYRRLSFDLVIIDEASQMLPEDALSAISRGGQLVVVGDPEQLPPTSFFLFGGQSDNEDEGDDGPPAESILELASSRYRPMRELLWHYRSRHESLIAFSNKHFYGDRLVVFPSSLQEDETRGVKHVFVQGRYQSGVRLNLPEANRLIGEARAFMRDHPDLSLGIATMNGTTAEYIQHEFDTLSESDREVRSYIERWEGTLDSFFVKNLENVQGDERDTIFIATVYGPDRSGKVHQRFGPINSQTGYRRLNVLFTRAKQHVRLFTSLRPQDIMVSERSHRGVQVLRDYLDYAATGHLETGTITGREPDSDFERLVIERLQNAGFKAISQVGVSGYRIDIGVRDPHKPHRFILGIECDGASYHSARSARDRDRIRQQILESLGWNIYRIWSTDWFSDPDAAFGRLLVTLGELTEASLKNQHSTQESITSKEYSFPPARLQEEQNEAMHRDEEQIEEGEQEEARGTDERKAVRIGDRVTYEYVDAIGEEHCVVIDKNPGEWSDRVISLDTPVARALLGAKENEVVAIALPREQRDAIVLQIERSP